MEYVITSAVLRAPSIGRAFDGLPPMHLIPGVHPHPRRPLNPYKSCTTPQLAHASRPNSSPISR